MESKLLRSTSEPRGVWLDPRTKLYMLVVFSIVMMDGKTGGISFVLKPLLSLIPFCLLFCSKRQKAALLYIVIFGVSWSANLFFVPYTSGAATILISLVAQLGARWFPSAIMGYYLLSTTKVNEFVLAMQKMHVPEVFIIPFSVMFRFFPTISEEANAIGKAMRMRGITGRNFFKKPSALLEYRLVPLMMSVVTVGNDLSAAALTRGLGGPKNRSSICKIGFRLGDILLALLATTGLILFLLFAGGVE